MDLIRYTYTHKVESYRINLSENKDLFVYHYNGKILPVITETKEENNQTITELINPLENSQLAVLKVKNTDKGNIVNQFGFYKPVNVETLDKSFKSKNLISNMNKAQECDDLAYMDCLDCTASDCGTSYWCVALLAVAGPETVVAIGVSCAFDL